MALELQVVKQLYPLETEFHLIFWNYSMIEKVEGKGRLEGKSVSDDSTGRTLFTVTVWPQIHLFWCKHGVQSLHLPPGSST